MRLDNKVFLTVCYFFAIYQSWQRLISLLLVVMMTYIDIIFLAIDPNLGWKHVVIWLVIVIIVRFCIRVRDLYGL